MYSTNATVDQIYCKGPAAQLDKKINDLVPLSFDCITTGGVQKILLIQLCFFIATRPASPGFFNHARHVFVPLIEFASYQSLKFESISVEAFSFGNEQYVVFAQPFIGKCSFLEWDHVEMVFRSFDDIDSKQRLFRIRCHVVVIELCESKMRRGMRLKDEPLDGDIRPEQVKLSCFSLLFLLTRHIHGDLQTSGH